MPIKPFLATTLLCGVLGAALILPARAQEERFKVSAPTIIQRPTGARLEGDRSTPARVQAPQLDVQAGVIAFDYSGEQVTEVRSLTQVGQRVQIKVDLAPKGGGAPAHIEATADKATLNPPARTLRLEGNVDGFYQVQQGIKTTLRGETVNAKYEGENLQVTVEGGANGVRLEVPPESLNQPGALGTIVFTAQRASLDKNGGVARLTGKAHAFSTDGPHKFDVTADEFVLTRTVGIGGRSQMDKLETIGRTQLKMDLPPEPAASTPPVEAGQDGDKIQIGRPTHVEAAADAMTITRPDNTLVFAGNVKGFYELAPAKGDASPRYDFTGDRAVVRYVEQSGEGVAAGLNVEVTGQPSTIELPGFNLGF